MVWTRALQSAKINCWVRRPMLGGSNERLDCDCPRRHNYGRFADYGRQRGTLRPGDYTQLFQHSRDDQFQLGPRDL